MGRQQTNDGNFMNCGEDKGKFRNLNKVFNVILQNHKVSDEWGKKLIKVKEIIITIDNKVYDIQGSPMKTLALLYVQCIKVSHIFLCTFSRSHRK